MTETGAVLEPGDSGEPHPQASIFQRIGVDWWAVIVAGAFVLLAVADALPKIPW
ncbi:hypothetical protein J2W56_006516 [Nocardia kruczakiae]|uniref:Uncharacterized protein n=1 Tax=Nocardia kruczakiae TaxID=261477 RepID=A0ABU1XQB6_9NOCA|nr:hypothetical protein [Nocardia kruczakiae]MDR7172750.1 hypothetical protein [Nocardia kruczakiae]